MQKAYLTSDGTTTSCTEYDVLHHQRMVLYILMPLFNPTMIFERSSKLTFARENLILQLRGCEADYRWQSCCARSLVAEIHTTHHLTDTQKELCSIRMESASCKTQRANLYYHFTNSVGWCALVYATSGPFSAVGTGALASILSDATSAPFSFFVLTSSSGNSSGIKFGKNLCSLFDVSFHSCFCCSD